MSTPILSAIHGKVLYPNDHEYELYRTVWNRKANGFPYVIIVASNEDDVANAIRYAVDINKPVCVCGGGHHFAGFAVQQDCVMIHLGQMNHVHVDIERERVRVGAGATVGQIDAVTQSHGLAVPTGTSSGTGIAGLTLGGGLGYLRRQYGMALDQLLRVRMVLADGRIVTADEKHNREIFWGIRGGGGNFGVVTEFEFQAFNVGPEVPVLDVFYDLSHFATVMNAIQDFPLTAPDTISFQVLISPVPAHPIYPISLHGKWVIRLLGMVNDDLTNGISEIQSLRSIVEPVFDMSGITRYTELQARLDLHFPSGNYYDGTSLFLDALTPNVLNQMEEELRIAEPVSFQLWMLGGQISRVLSDKTAYPMRSAQWGIFINAAGSDVQKLDIRSKWMRGAISRIGAVSGTTNKYVNAIGSEEAEEFNIAKKIYDTNYNRLRQLKTEIDPLNTFRHNINITPSNQQSP